MPDISMCKNNQCPSKNKCFRYMAIANPHRQSYAGFTVDMNDRCSSFVNINNYSNSRVRKLDENIN